MRIVEIREDKFEKMGELTEKVLKYGGKLMSCISEMGEEHGISFREDGMNYREHEDYGRYGHTGGHMNGRYPYMGYRDDEDEMEEMHERRRRNRMGRYY